MPSVQVTVGGHRFLVEDLTLDEIVEVERETGQTWTQLNPLRSATHARAIMVRFLARDVGDDEARAQVGGMRVGDAVQAIDVVKDDRPDEFVNGAPVVDPKADAAAPAMT